MGMFSFLSRPDWQSRDAGKRASAIANSHDPAMLQALPQILRQDPVAAVRRAALDRCDDLTLIADRMRNDSDAVVRERSKARLLELLCSKQPLDTRLRALGLVEEAAMLEQVARRADERELRLAALERCTRPGFLAERCMDDPDSELRLQILERIDNATTIERIANHARNRDKRLARAARERLDSGKRASGEAASLLQRAESLCLRLEQRLRDPGTGADAELLAVEAEWLALRPRIDERFDLRYAGSKAALSAAIHAITNVARGNAAPTSASPEPEASTIEPAVAARNDLSAQPTDTELATELATATTEAEPSDLGDSQAAANASPESITTAEEADAPPSTAPLRPTKPTLSDAELQALQQRADNALVAYAQAVDAGRLQDARLCRAQLQQAARALPKPQRLQIEQRMQAREADFDKLARWQHWSDNKVRVRLCEELEALVGSGLHPDALSNRVGEIKLAWQRIDDSEKDPSSPEVKESGLAKRYRFLCHRALEPAKGYFEKRREVRGRRSDELSEFLTRAATQADDAATAVTALIALKQEVADRLRRLDEIDPRRRGETGRQLKQLIDRISGAIDARFEAVAAEKQKLIAQLRRQLTHAELDQALDLAKSAQKRWQGLGKGSRKSDQSLWDEFRALIDPLFEQKNDALKAVDNERAAGQAAARACIDQMAALANSDDEAERIEQAIDTIDATWSTEEQRPRDLERAFDQALSRARARVEQRRQQALQLRSESMAEIAAALDTIEGAWLDGESSETLGAALADCLQRIDALPSALSAALKDRALRVQTALAQPAGTQDTEAAARAAETLLLEYEFLAGVDSPPEHKQARLALQVEKLALRMSSGSSPAIAEQLQALDRRWWGSGPLSREQRSELSRRRDRALAALR